MALFLPQFHAHLEVVAILATAEALYLWAVARLGPRSVRSGEPPATRRQITAFTAGVGVLLVASTWPIHDRNAS